MKITFLGQGFEPSSINAVGHHLIANLNSKDFHSFTGLSAFASEAGIFGLSPHIQAAKSNFQNLTLIVGIDQEGTSEEALNQILALDINSFIFYQKEPPIFHPKIYLFEGDCQTKLIVGSSNLTGRGLFANIESSLLIEFDNEDKEGIALLLEVKSYYNSLFDFSDPNLFKISSVVIEDFIKKGFVPDEAIRRIRYEKKVIENEASELRSTGGINIPRRVTSRIPNTFLKKPRRSNFRENVIDSNKINSSIIVPDNETLVIGTPLDIIILDDRLVWESGPLTERDLNVPKGKTTNATGSMLFKKGKTEGIDQRHYFRDEVFKLLPWANDSSSATAHIERATAFFHFIIEGVDHGTFPLILSHNTKTESKTYLQKNSMTSLSWGKAKSLIAKEALINKTAKLFKSADGTENTYTLIIQ